MQPTGESSKKSGPRMYFYFWRRRRTGLVAMRTQWLKPKYNDGNSRKESRYNYNTKVVVPLAGAHPRADAAYPKLGAEAANATPSSHAQVQAGVPQRLATTAESRTTRPEKQNPNKKKANKKSE
jgi:hypothetical protein